MPLRLNPTNLSHPCEKKLPTILLFSCHVGSVIIACVINEMGNGPVIWVSFSLLRTRHDVLASQRLERCGAGIILIACNRSVLDSADCLVDYE